MLPYSILIADDDEKLLTVLRSYFEQDQCLVYTAQTGRQALDILKRYEPQLLVLDVMMPDMDGFEVCRHVRQTNDIPIIFLTARDDETDRLVGLNIGADDYVTKPFNVKELMARAHAMLRRARGEVIQQSSQLIRGDLFIDKEKLKVTRNGEAV